MAFDNDRELPFALYGLIKQQAKKAGFDDVTSYLTTAVGYYANRSKSKFSVDVLGLTAELHALNWSLETLAIGDLLIAELIQQLEAKKLESLETMLADLKTDVSEAQSAKKGYTGGGR